MVNKYTTTLSILSKIGFGTGSQITIFGHKEGSLSQAGESQDDGEYLRSIERKLLRYPKN